MSFALQTNSFFEIFYLIASLCLLFGHNLWLVKRSEDNENAEIEINTGDTFPQSEVAIRPERIKEFKIMSVGETQQITDFRVKGNSLTTTIAKEPDVAFVAAIELYPHPIELEGEKFARYIEDEDAWLFTAPYFTAEKKDGTQRESYAKFAKALVKNNVEEEMEIFISRVGHRLEIIPVGLSEIPRKKLRVQVLFDGEPIESLRVSGGAKGLNNGSYLTHTRTDKKGFAEIEIYPERLQFLRTHFIRRHPDPSNFEWESFWASITFNF